MTSVVRQGNLVSIPDEIARALNLHEGSRVEWEPSSDGAFILRGEASALPGRRLRGLLKPYLKPGESGVEEFLRWREEDAKLDGSL